MSSTSDVSASPLVCTSTFWFDSPPMCENVRQIPNVAS